MTEIRGGWKRRTMTLSIGVYTEGMASTEGEELRPSKVRNSRLSCVKGYQVSRSESVPVKEKEEKKT